MSLEVICSFLFLDEQKLKRKSFESYIKGKARPIITYVNKMHVPPPWRNGLACWTSNSKVVGSNPTGGEFMCLFSLHFFYNNPILSCASCITIKKKNYLVYGLFSFDMSFYNVLKFHFWKEVCTDTESLSFFIVCLFWGGGGSFQDFLTSSVSVYLVLFMNDNE